MLLNEETTIYEVEKLKLIIGFPAVLSFITKKFFIFPTDIS